MDIFREGAKVEVSINEPGFEESYSATVLGHGFTDDQRIVVYGTMKNESNSSLIEILETEQLRPRPISMQLRKYRVGDIVDAYMRGGWWTVKVVYKTREIYVVEAQHPWEFLLFPVWRLRLYQEYENDVWFYSKMLK